MLFLSSYIYVLVMFVDLLFLVNRLVVVGVVVADA